jgi:hypothetical protein
MPVIDYAALQGIATQFIADFGRRAILRDDDDNDATITAVLVDYGARERDGALILPHDKRALISVNAAGDIPDPEIHSLVIDGLEYRFVQVDALAPGGTTLYFDCQVRR